MSIARCTACNKEWPCFSRRNRHGVIIRHDHYDMPWCGSVCPRCRAPILKAKRQASLVKAREAKAERVRLGLLAAQLRAAGYTVTKNHKETK